MTQSARKAARARPALTIDMVVDSGRWKTSDKAVSLARNAVEEAAAMLSTSPAELAIVLTDDSAIRSLNRVWRHVDSATNVLAFPTERSGGEPPLLGDIVLAHETISREARAAGKPFAHHVAHLAVHGFLHLVGYDHGRVAEAKAMESVEREVMRRLAIPDPYAERQRSARSEGRRLKP